jgi:hypothetical protein
MKADVHIADEMTTVRLVWQVSRLSSLVKTAKLRALSPISVSWGKNTGTWNGLSSWRPSPCYT